MRLLGASCCVDCAPQHGTAPDPPKVPTGRPKHNHKSAINSNTQRTWTTPQVFKVCLFGGLRLDRRRLCLGKLWQSWGFIVWIFFSKPLNTDNINRVRFSFCFHTWFSGGKCFLYHILVALVASSLDFYVFLFLLFVFLFFFRVFVLWFFVIVQKFWWQQAKWWWHSSCQACGLLSNNFWIFSKVVIISFCSLHF